MLTLLYDFFLGMFAFAISGIDDFSVLVLLLMSTKKKKRAYTNITLGTITALSLVVVFSYFIGNIVGGYIWILGFFLIVFSIYNLFFKKDDEEYNEQSNEINLLKYSFVIYLMNASDDIAFYASYFASALSTMKEIIFVLGIYFSAFIVIAIAVKLSAILKSVDKIRFFIERWMDKIPYCIMLVIGIIIIAKHL